MIPTGQTVVVLAVAGEWLDLLFYGTCLAVALLLAALVIEVVRRWSRRGPATPSASDQLGQYRALYRRGEISQQEFDRLRAVLGGEIVAHAKPPAPPAPKESNGQPPSADGVKPV
jgi:hypothetical protein